MQAKRFPTAQGGIICGRDGHLSFSRKKKDCKSFLAEPVRNEEILVGVKGLGELGAKYITKKISECYYRCLASKKNAHKKYLVTLSKAVSL